MRFVLPVVAGLFLVSGCSQPFTGPMTVPHTEFAPEETPQPEADPTPAPVEAPPADQPAPPADQPAPPADQPAPPADEPPPPPADEPPADEPPPGPVTPAPVECGPNSFESAGACTCDANYTQCDSSDASVGCCAYGIDTFRITMVSAEVLPYEDPEDESPWDWTGIVPGWLQDVISEVVVYLDEDAQGWAEIVGYVIDFAPELLEGSTPPDPLVEFSIDGEELYSTDAQDNTIEPVWNDAEIFTVGDTDELTLWFMDEDFDFDDPIGGVFFTQEQLQWYAGLGPVTFGGGDGLNSFTVEIEPRP